MVGTAKYSVSVIALYMGEGHNLARIPANPGLISKYRVIPIKILTSNGDKIIIDRVLDIRRQASTKAGGLGDRYSVLN